MADINRRQFLSAAGATGAIAAFPSIARALAIPASVKTGTINDIEHVVILMQENRAFDHYFGTLSGVRGFSDPYPAPTAPQGSTESRNVFLQHNSTKDGPEWISPFPLNTRQTFAHMRVEGTPHSWPDAQEAWDHGRMGTWPDAKNLHSMGHFEQEDMPFQFALADAFTLCDAYHCSAQVGTNTNRLFLWSGTNDGGAMHGGPSIGNSHDNLPQNGGYPEGYTWTTYVERLQEAGVDWTIYQDMANNFTDNPLVGFKTFQDSYAGLPDSDPELAKRALSTRALDKLREDAINNSLPSVSYIIATAEGSEHPGPSSPAQGAAYTADVLDALTANPDVWSKTALFIMFDENDGFFDHMPPPAPPSPDSSYENGYAGISQVSTENEYHLHFSEADKHLEKEKHNGSPYGLGPRVPAYVISPWSRGGYVNSEIMDHTSIIRFLENRFGVHEPNISPWRRAVCGDFTSAFDFKTPNKSQLPAFPNPRSDAELAAMLPERTTPPIPEATTQPKQKAGLRPHRPSVYDIDISTVAKKAKNVLIVDFKNRGHKAAVFHVYDHHHLDAIPRRYTVEPQNHFQDSWKSINGTFDIQVMGPEGFHRRIRTSVNSEHNENVELDIAQNECFITAHAKGYQIQLNNSKTGSQTLPVGAKISVPTDSNKRYDLKVVHQNDQEFLAEFAGRLPG